MKIEAARCGLGESGAAPPHELQKYWQIKATGIPLMAGGLNDQPAGFIVKGIHLYNIWLAHQDMMRNIKNHQRWVEENPDLAQIVFEIQELRDAYGQL
jgi:hypothetical protein